MVPAETSYRSVVLVKKKIWIEHALYNNTEYVITICAGLVYYKLQRFIIL